MSKHGMIRGSVSSIVKYISSTFDEFRKNISTFISNVLPSASKNSGSKTPRHQSSHEAYSRPPRKPHGKVKSREHYEEAYKKAEKQRLGVLHEELNVLRGIFNRFEKKTKKKPRKGQSPQRQQSSPPRGNSGFFKFW